MLSKISFTVTISIVITIFVKSEARGKQWRCPPSHKVCECNSRNNIPYTADCHKKNLTSIPKFEKKYQKLKFSGNILVHLKKTTFTNLINVPITELFINACKIEHVEADTFDSLSLDFINFGKNEKINVTQLANCFRNLNLKGIDLSEIPLNDKVVDFFNTTTSASLVFLRMAKCNLTSLTKSVFEHLQNLIELDVSGNKLKFIDLSIIPPIKTLVAKDTDILELPRFNETMVSPLVLLDVGYNFIADVSPLFTFGQLFTNLSHLFIDSNPLQSLPRDIFSKLNSLSSLSLCNITSQLSDFSGIESRSLKYLNISNNIIDPIYSKLLFYNSRNLEVLKMNDTSLKKWSDDELFLLFTPLYAKLRKLLIMKTYFQSIPSRALRRFKKLEVLDLSSNNISGWNKDTFENVTVKKRLLLKNNLIQYINASSIPDSMLYKTKLYLDFRGNPFSCTCKAHWFRQWMKGNYYRLRGSLGDNYLCHSPPQWEMQQFVQFDPSYEDCHGMEIEVLLGISVCCACMIAVSVATYLVNLYRKKYQNSYTIIK